RLRHTPEPLLDVVDRIAGSGHRAAEADQKPSKFARAVVSARSRGRYLGHASPRAVCLQEQRLAERHVLDLRRSDALLRRVAETRRLLDADEHALRLRERLLEHVAQRDRPALPLRRDGVVIRMFHRVRERVVRGTARRTDKRLPTGLALELDMYVPGRCG